MNLGSILHEDLTYAMLHEMVMKKFNLEAIYPLNLSAKVSPIDDNFDIIDDHEVRFFVECASEDELAHLHAAIALAVQYEFPLAYHVEAASVKVSKDLLSNGARVVVSTSQTHRVAGKIQLFVSHHQIDLSMVLIPNDGSLEEALEGADMKTCVYLKSVRDELLRSMEEKR
nr:hypothetical protein [Tanacetum cinerariifolium]